VTYLSVSRDWLIRVLTLASGHVADNGVLQAVTEGPSNAEFPSASQPAESLTGSLSIKYAHAVSSGLLLSGHREVLHRLEALGSASVRLVAVDAPNAFFSVFLDDSDSSLIGVVAVEKSIRATDRELS
jgi:hypothetical protein